MGAFLAEYGKIIVVIIVIAALIALAMLFKISGTANATGSFDSFLKIANLTVVNAEVDAQGVTP